MFLIKVLFLSLSYLCLGQTAPALNYHVHIFYYPWYGNTDLTQPKTYRHWNQNKHKPPEDIASDFYPVLGAYDSCDPKVLAQHMNWISQSGVGVVMTSWWGQNSPEDKCVLKIMDSAHKHQLKVGFHIESYGKRTAQSTADDIRYINKRYGSHPAYYRDPTHGNRPAFYIYSSVITKDWTPIRALLKDNILLGSTYNYPNPVNNTENLSSFSGFYPYGIGVDPYYMNHKKWKDMNDFCKSKGLIWSPSVGPGYLDKRAKANTKSHQFERNNGQTYDKAWNNLFEAGIPHWVSITSFNEWHEGSIIEPASHSPPKGIPYLTYNGAYNKTGKASETAYIERTLHWVNEFTKRSKSLK